MNDARSRLASALGLKPAELGRASALFALSFLLGLSLVSLDVALSTTLLLDLDSGELPWAQVVLAASVPLSGFVLAWLKPRVSVAVYVTAPLGVATIIILGLLALHGGGQLSIPVVLALWASYHVLMAVAIIGFWTVAARTFDLEQSRRAYGVISAGELIAGILGGLAAGPLRAALDLPVLVGVAALGVLAGVLLTIPLAGRLEPDPADHAPHTPLAGEVRAHALRCFAYYGLSNFTYDVLQFLVFVSVQRRYPGDPDAIAGLVGVLLSVRFALGAALRLFVTGRLLDRHGLSVALTSTPIAVIACALLAVVILPFGVPLLVATITLQTLEATVRGGFGKPAFMASQRPMPTAARERTLLLIETAVEPITTGLAGLTLLVVPVAALSDAAILSLALPGAVAWVIIARALHRSYQHLVDTFPASRTDAETPASVA